MTSWGKVLTLQKKQTRGSSAQDPHGQDGQTSLPPAAAGKDGRRGALAGIHVFINKLKLMSLFTGSKTMQDSKAGESQACGREGRGADPHGLSSSTMGSW